MSFQPIYNKVSPTTECNKEIFPQVSPQINVYSKEITGFPCSCQNIDGPIVRFYSPITGKIYVRTFSAGGARIPININNGNPIPTSTTELKELLQMRRPESPLHLPPLTHVPSNSIEDIMRNQAEFYDEYNSMRKKCNAEKRRPIDEKLPSLVHSPLPIPRPTIGSCGLRSWNSTESTEQSSDKKLPRIPKLYNRYRKPLEDEALDIDKTETNYLQPHTGSTDLPPTDTLHIPKFAPVNDRRNGFKVDPKLQEWREKIRKRILPADDGGVLQLRGTLRETRPSEVFTKVVKHEYDELEEGTKSEKQHLPRGRKLSIHLPMPDRPATAKHNKNTRLLWRNEQGGDSTNDDDSVTDLVSKHGLSASNPRSPDKFVPPKVINKITRLPSIYDTPSKTRERSREQFRRSTLEVRRENLCSMSLRQVQMKRNRLQRNPEKCPENEEDPAYLIKKAIKKMKSTSWNESAKGLEETVQLSTVAPHLLEPYMNTVYRHLIQLLRSLRSTVVRIACNVARQLFRTMKCTLRPEFDEIGGILVHKTADTNRFIREDANCALDEMVTHIPALNTVRVIVDKGASHKNALVRIAVARLLTCVVALAGPENILVARGPKETRKRILQTIAKFMDDCSLETREYARKLYRQLLEYDEFEFHFHNDVENSVLRRIEKTMIKLKYDSESAIFDEDEN